MHNELIHQLLIVKQNVRDHDVRQDQNLQPYNIQGPSQEQKNDKQSEEYQSIPSMPIEIQLSAPDSFDDDFSDKNGQQDRSTSNKGGRSSLFRKLHFDKKAKIMNSSLYSNNPIFQNDKQQVAEQRRHSYQNKAVQFSPHCLQIRSNNNICVINALQQGKKNDYFAGLYHQSGFQARKKGGENTQEVKQIQKTIRDSSHSDQIGFQHNWPQSAEVQNVPFNFSENGWNNAEEDLGYLKVLDMLCIPDEKGEDKQDFRDQINNKRNYNSDAQSQCMQQSISPHISDKNSVNCPFSDLNDRLLQLNQDYSRKPNQSQVNNTEEGHSRLQFELGSTKSAANPRQSELYIPQKQIRVLMHERNRPQVSRRFIHLE
ncbi:hypothetical protein FGO68_gene9832 [Halteria grandinella]|uniref:Uncharacterized protein n=1 Tax=Halteria grandinella TaxID=5974 RepID=A0A8J8NSX2_HALGN|nr:hypothetical protein FGO68_gene9832 [Halteria grandinella]